MTVRLQAIRPKKFQLVDPDMTRLNISHGTEAYLNSVRKQLQSDYGRVPVSKRYRRTFALSRGWKVEVSPDGASGTLTNDTPYAVFAQGPRRHGERTSVGSAQAAAMRRRGWRSITDVARETRHQYVEIMNRSIKGSSPVYFSV